MPRLPLLSALPLLCALFVVLLAACGSGIDAGDEVAEPADVTAHAAQRCLNCGWIESKRKLPSSVTDPRSLGTYEYTVRMADGSSSIFQEALPTTWRVGERLSIIAGKGPPAGALPGQ